MQIDQINTRQPIMYLFATMALLSEYMGLLVVYLFISGLLVNFG